MGLLSSIIGLPFAPIRGVVRLGELIQDQVEQQMHDPARIRRELEEIDAAARAGAMSPDDKRAAQQRVVGRVAHGHVPPRRREGPEE